LNRRFYRLKKNDAALVGPVIDAKEEINRIVNELNMHLMHRLGSNEPNRRATYRLETEIVEYLKRVYYFAKANCKGAEGYNKRQ